MPECPKCVGTGRTGPVHINRGNRPHEWRENIECDQCDGTGTVSEQMTDWIEHGRLARRHRQERGRSLQEHARLIDISPSDVSAMERGRRDPSPLFD